jgi:hypothetical protein
MDKQIIVYYEDKDGRCGSASGVVPEEKVEEARWRTFTQGLNYPGEGDSRVYVPGHRVLSMVVRPVAVSAVDLAAEHLDTIEWKPGAIDE